MKESNLAKTIDRLAQRKAEDFMTHVKTVITNALKDTWRAKVAGGHDWLGEDVKAVLLAYAESIGVPDGYKHPRPSADLVNSCRATIVNDLLNGLPKLKELAMMQAGPDEYQGAGHVDHHQD